MELLNLAWNICIELVFAYPIISIALLAVFIIAWILGLAGGRGYFKSTVLASIGVSILVGAVAFFALPMLFKSSISEMTYYMDWAFHLVTVFGAMVYAYLVVWPLMAAFK